MAMIDVLVSRPSEEVTVLTFNRPAKRNALSADLVERLHDELDKASANGARLLVLQGEGAAFCSGFDLTGLEQETDGDLLLRFVRIEMLLHRIFSAQFVTLALAHGRVTGAGADLFAACDRRVIVDKAIFSFPGSNFGIVLGTGRLIGRIGSDRTREVIRSGREISATEALECGLAHGKVSMSDLEGVLSREREAAIRLDRATVRAIHKVASTDGAGDMAQLAWSAARPGLKKRILAYRERVRSGKSE